MKRMARGKSRATIAVPKPALAAAAALIVVALLVAGCGGSSKAESSGSSKAESSFAASGGQGGSQISEEAQACLKEQGVEMPEPGQGGREGGGPPGGVEMPEGAEPPSGGAAAGGPPSAGNSAKFKKMQEALEECGVEMSGKPGGPNTSSTAFKAQVTEYVACMKENGVELPEPDFSGKGPVFEESEVNREGAEFRRASAKCQSLLGGPGGGPGAGSESATGESGSET